MVTVGMNYQVVPGKEKEFESVFGKVLQIMGAMDGHVQTRLFRDVADPGSYMILSAWSSRESFDAFTGSQQFKNVTNWGKSQILSAQPRHQIFGETKTTPPRSCPAHAGGS